MTPSKISHAYYSEKVSLSNDSKQKDDNVDLNGMSAKLLKSRTVIISQQVNSELSAKVLNQLVLLEQEDPKQGITVFINSPGGEIFSGFAIFDMLKFIECPITTLVTEHISPFGFQVTAVISLPFL